MAINKPGFIKIGEAMTINLESVESCLPAVSADMLEEFRKTAADLKKIAPKAEDFLYFSAVMMHAAEAAGLHDDGSPRMTSRGEKVEVGWDKSGGTWKWMSNDPNVKPYKNSNGDIFPEEELIKAYKKWQHKPLCIDHKSSSVDHVRGFIVDTYYDRNLKRVVALCALDKAGYPQLARQVSTGVSNCVSMGTAVGKAICTDCARVARTESDFCDHMRKKSCYGEINIDLNPIELSIVVNGADPRANIKHIIASANTLNQYLEAQASKLDIYQATITNASGSPISISGNDLESFKNDFNRALGELESINSKISEKDTNDMVSNQSPDSLSESGSDNSGLAPPARRYASADVEVDSIAELHKVTAAIQTKLNQMKQSLDKLEKTSTQIQEENMSGSNNINKTGYFQGTEEPTPGSPKYTKDPLNEKLRTDGDKQMEGASPFPDTGSVTDLYPGDLEKKKLLARAEAEERAMRRNAIVNLAKQALEDKTAYFQNDTGGKENPGTPKPGQVKYPADKLNLDARDDDKHMNGKKPFPGVGPVDGMYPEDLKTKELHSRASLRARFVKVPNANGTQDLSKSAWEVFLGDKLLLTASVEELSRGRTDLGYSNIATKEYGAKLIETVKTFGSDGVKAFLKQAQDAAAPAAPPPAAPEAPAVGDEGGEDKGGDGDPKVAALKLAEKVRDLSSDLVEAVRALTGEQAEMGEEAAAPEMGMGATASDESFSTTAFNSIRQELNSALTAAIKESVATLTDHAQELEMISGMYDKGAVNSKNEEVVGSLVEDALSEAKSAVADGFKLMTAFVKYARGTKAIVKRAEIEAELNALAEGDVMSADNTGGDLMALINDTNADLDNVADMMGDDNDMADPLLDGEEFSLEGEGLALAADDDLDAQFNIADGAQVPSNLKPEDVVNVTASFNSRAGRAAMRAKIAADATGKQDDGQLTDMSKQKFSDMLDQANRLADGQTDLDTAPSDSLGRVETLAEKNKAMLDVATAPPKVRKEAEAIHRLVSEGKLDPADLDALVAEGLDKDAVAYWKKFYGQVDGGSEFASELVKEHVKAELEAELNTYKVKLARSYELAYDMADRGLCHHERSAISDQVEEIMKFNDDSFESLKRVVARHAPVLRKEAGRMPQVGFLGDGEINTAAPVDDYAQLSAMFSKNTKRGSF